MRANAERKTMRGDHREDGPHLDDELMKPKKGIEAYDQVYSQGTQFFSTYNPDWIEESLIKYLKENKIEPKVKDDKYKMKFEVKNKT
jgi:cytochrome c2